MTSQIIPVILSGGSGTRLWPLSRSMRPKQFINLVGETSLFQSTIERIKSLNNASNPIVVCNEEHRFIVAEQLQEMEAQHNAIILEPCGRNTAPAIAAAAYKLSIADQLDDALMLVLPADHLIDQLEQFAEAVARAVSAAEQNQLVTFGVTPDNPATGFGYIKAEKSVSENIRSVESFKEKPDAETANQYLLSGDYFWNGGMFLMKVSTFIAELEHFEKPICDVVAESVRSAQRDLDFFRLGDDSYAQCRNISIDYAVMEKSKRVSMVELNAGWSDVGSWTALWESGMKDGAGNVTRGDVLLESVSNSYVHSENRLVSAIGVEDLIVVETHDGIMVTSKQHDQGVKQIVALLQKAGRSETELHRKAFRPWGNYDCLDSGDQFQVKRIMVKPGECTSMQRHFKRAEHWIVVSGVAEVTCGENTFLLNENESTFIPLGSQHRLKNPGNIPLELIEVQSGSYLGEDDIERIDDEYGRS